MTTTTPAPGAVRYHAVRLVLKAVTSAYVRTRLLDVEHIPPEGPYIICFNHPSWLDPVFFAAHWPDRERKLYIFGPRERDMSRGLRNHLITWTRRGVPFKPDAADVMDATRRAVAVLKDGDCLAIAGEGRLSDHEGEILPLETGLAHFARLADAPILPVAVVGTRWVSFGSDVTIKVGRAVHPGDYAGGRAGCPGHDRSRSSSSCVACCGAWSIATLLAGSVAQSRRPSTTAPGWMRRKAPRRRGERAGYWRRSSTSTLSSQTVEPEDLASPVPVARSLSTCLPRPTLRT